ncbi:unnamed protein product [Bubo scandiacus]
MAPRDALSPTPGPLQPPRALPHPQPPPCTPGVSCAKHGAFPPLTRGLAVPGGLAGPGGGRCPRPGYPPRSAQPRSHAMAIAEELRSGCFWRGVLAEAAATLIFVGVVLGASAAPGPLAPALAGGLVAAALTCTLGAPQANPALTIALLCTRKLGALRGAAGLLAQGAGAVLASAAARLALPDDTSLVTKVSVPPVPVPVPGLARSAEARLSRQVTAGTAGQALAWETFATFQLALAAFAAADRASPQGGLVLGSAVAAGALAAGPLSGGSMNPARSLGPAIVTGIWDDHWVYWLGPVLGAVLAGISYEFIFAPGASREKLGACLACRDVARVETTSPSPSSPSARAPPAPPAERGQGTA